MAAGRGGLTGWCAPGAGYGPAEYSKVGLPACMVSYVVNDGAWVVAVEPSEISSDIFSLYAFRSVQYLLGKHQSAMLPQNVPPAKAPIGGKRLTVSDTCGYTCPSTLVTDVLSTETLAHPQSG